MESDRLATFRAVAREGGFSRAGRVLHKTQPAVSQSIAALEDELGATLFERLGRTVRLTQAGEVLYEHAVESAAALERAQDRLLAIGALREGRLAIGTSDTTTCYVLPPVLAAFRERHPGVELVLSNRTSPVTAAQVAAREVDLGIVTLPGDPKRLPAKVAAEPLAPREDVAICAPSHPLAARRRVRIETLLDHPLLLLDRGSQTRAFIDERIAQSGGVPDVAMELASIEVIKRLVALDFGVSIVPAIAVTAEVARGELCAASLVGRGAARRLGLLRPARGASSPAAAAFATLVRQHLGG